MVVIKTFTYVYNLAANERIRITVDNFGYSIPAGYVPIGVYAFSTGSDQVALNTIQTYSTANRIMICRNMTSSSLSDLTAFMTVAFMKAESVTSLDS